MGRIAFIALGLLALGAEAHEGKRIDKCGCHQQYGLRHCHPKRRTPRCEAPVRGESRAAPKPANSTPPQTADRL